MPVFYLYAPTELAVSPRSCSAITPFAIMQQHDKNEIEQIQNVYRPDEGIEKDRELEPAQIQALDKLSVWQAAKVYRKIGLFCFIAAFSASLDGYQGERASRLQWTASSHPCRFFQRLNRVQQGIYPTIRAAGNCHSRCNMGIGLGRNREFRSVLGPDRYRICQRQDR